MTNRGAEFGNDGNGPKTFGGRKGPSEDLFPIPNRPSVLSSYYDRLEQVKQEQALGILRQLFEACKTATPQQIMEEILS